MQVLKWCMCEIISVYKVLLSSQSSVTVGDADVYTQVRRVELERLVKAVVLDTPVNKVSRESPDSLVIRASLAAQGSLVYRVPPGQRDSLADKDSADLQVHGVTLGLLDQQVIRATLDRRVLVDPLDPLVILASRVLSELKALPETLVSQDFKVRLI